MSDLPLRAAPPARSPQHLADIEALEQTPWQQLVPAQSTYDMLRQSCARHPQQIALRFVLSGEAGAPEFTVTYQALLDKVTQAANAFHRADIGPGQAVALLLPNLPETHYALWGAQAAGIASPINPLLDVEHIAAIVDATQAEALVALAPLPGSDTWDKAMAVAVRCPSIRTVFAVGIDAYTGPAQQAALRAALQTALQAAQASANPGAPHDTAPTRRAAGPEGRGGLRIVPFDTALSREDTSRLTSGRAIAPDDVCAYFHTGGTTGLPKVAVHTHRNETFVAAMLALMQPDPHVVLCGLPLFHVNGAMVTGLGALHAGWEVVLLTPQGYRGPGVMPNFWRLVERFRATTFSGVPTIFATLANLPKDGADIASLRHAFCGAAPLPPEVARRFEEAAGIPLCEGYGLTEGACISSVNPIGVARRPGSVGLRLPHQPLQAWRVDGAGQAITPCAPGETGVIGISGPNVFPGYLRERDNHAIWLRPGWLNTGDLGYIDDDGYLHLTGRAKDLIIRGGHNIDPALIEDALLRHPAVAMAAAVGQPDAHAGELPMVYVTLKPGADASTGADADSLLDAARALVPERAAVPVRVEILPQMPLTAIGKVAKAELRMRSAETVLRALLDGHGIDAMLNVAADTARGAVVRLRCAAADAEHACALLGRFPYPVDLLPEAGKD